jgi:hypothetical protein
MNAESRRTLGYRLLAIAAGVAVLLLVWLMVSGVQAGGFVLGLLLLLVLAGPAAAAGWYALARGHTEKVEELAFVGKRRVVDAWSASASATTHARVRRAGGARAERCRDPRRE